jgi:hypothetical protein
MKMSFLFIRIFLFIFALFAIVGASFPVQRRGIRQGTPLSCAPV